MGTQRATHGDETGFTLVELLVVVLIIGILAALALPIFLKQSEKANDASAKVQVRTAETAAETYGIDHSGKYEGVSIEELQAIDGTLKQTTPAKLEKVEAGKEGGYVIESKSLPTGNVFKLERTKTGEIVRTCNEPGKASCPPSGSW